MSAKKFRIPKEMELAKTALWARVENTIYGECPLCKEEMDPSSANGIPVLTCLKDRIVMPAKNIG
jgi:hypothetical protein